MKSNSKTKTKTKLVGWAYIRVSTADQGNMLHGSMEQQNHRLKRWAETIESSTGLTHEIVRTFDEEKSGSKKALARRIKYNEIKEAVSNRTIDFVVIEKIDRLNRNLNENRDFAELCAENDVKLYFVDLADPINLKDKGSRTAYVMQSFMAEEYSLDLVEKMTKKQREARYNNGKDSSTYAVLGLDPHPEKSCFYTINLAEKTQVIDIFSYFLEHGDLSETAKYANARGFRTKVKATREKVVKGRRILSTTLGGIEFDADSIRRLLVNRRIAGFGYFLDDWDQFVSVRDENKMVKYEFAHGRVIDTALFESVQNLLKKNAKHNHRNHSNQKTYFLSGTLFDIASNSYCGQKGKGIPYYYCKETGSRIPANKIEATVLKYVRDILKSDGKWAKLIENTLRDKSQRLYSVDDDIALNLKKQKEIDGDLQTFDNKLLTALKSENTSTLVLDEIVKLKQKRESELESLKDDLGKLRDKQDKVGALERQKETKQFLSKVLAKLDKSNSLVKKRLIQSIIPRVVIDGKGKKLHIYINPVVKGCKPVEENVRMEDGWLPPGRLCEDFSSHQYLHGITDFYTTPLYKDRVFLHQKYVEEQLSTRKIAAQIFSSRSAVASNLKEFGIPLRSTDEAHRLNQGQVCYGQKRVKNQDMVHKREQEIISKMRQLRDQGLSYHKIAAVLNTMKVPTKNRGSRWHGTTVMNILNLL